MGANTAENLSSNTYTGLAAEKDSGLHDWYGNHYTSAWGDPSASVAPGNLQQMFYDVYGTGSTSPEHQQWINEINSSTFNTNQQYFQGLFNQYDKTNNTNLFANKDYLSQLQVLANNPNLLYTNPVTYTKYTHLRDNNSSGEGSSPMLEKIGFDRFNDTGYNVSLALSNYLNDKNIEANGMSSFSTQELKNMFNLGLATNPRFDSYLKSHPEWNTGNLVNAATSLNDKINDAREASSKAFQKAGVGTVLNMMTGAGGYPGVGGAITSLAYGDGPWKALRTGIKGYLGGKIGAELGASASGGSDALADIGSEAGGTSGEAVDYATDPSVLKGAKMGDFNWDNVSGVGAGGDFLGGADTGWGTTPQVPSSYSMGDYQGFNPSSFDSGGNTFSDLYGQLKNSPIVQNYLKPATMFAQQNAPLIKAGLGYIYSNQNAKQNLRRAQQQYDNINSSVAGLRDLYSPNSPYAIQMQKEMDARDAAAGRRSQYGQRSVELAAKLADQQVRAGQAMSGAYNNMNQLGSYMDQLKNTPRNALVSFAQPEVLKNLYDLF